MGIFPFILLFLSVLRALCGELYYQLLFIQLPYHSCNLANDMNIALPLFNNDRFHCWMFWFQMYRMPLFIKSLYGRLVIYEGNHDLSVICYRLWFNEDKDRKSVV